MRQLLDQQKRDFQQLLSQHQQQQHSAKQEHYPPVLKEQFWIDSPTEASSSASLQCTDGAAIVPIQPNTKKRGLVFPDSSVKIFATTNNSQRPLASLVCYAYDSDSENDNDRAAHVSMSPHSTAATSTSSVLPVNTINSPSSPTRPLYSVSPSFSHPPTLSCRDSSEC